MISHAPILCSTARLAQGLRDAYDRQQLAEGRRQWQPLAALTLQQWLDALLEQALLLGQIPPQQAPSQVLDATQELILWEQAIDTALRDQPLAALFDQSGMALAAMQANQLMIAWNLVPNESEQTEETRQFMRWRRQFRQQCEQQGWLEAARHLDWQIAHLQNGVAELPGSLFLAGFDRVSPQLQRLFDVLRARGVALQEWPGGLPEAGLALQQGYEDAEAECRAAVAWAAEQLRAKPGMRLAIVVPQLASLRSRLGALLDDTLQPQTLRAQFAQSARRYDFSLGQPLAEQPMIASALAILQLALRPDRVGQQELGGLLRDPYACLGDADIAANLEAQMRRNLPASVSLQQALQFMRSLTQKGWPLQPLLAQLQALLRPAWPRRQPVSGWSTDFEQLLSVAGWPGVRSLSSHEYQAQQKWRDTLADFARLDSLLGRLDAAQALNRLAQFCRDSIFQPEAEGEVSIVISGMLEAAATPFDAIWVMGMNDHQWPPPPGPNALLPAALQRRVGVPNADSRVQAEFAAAIHRRLLHSAPQLVFSWAHREGERELRMSPVLAGMPAAQGLPDPVKSMAEQLAQPARMQQLEDHLAPPVAADEHVRGGTGLLKAQAICPAWAFYRYRLGARALEDASEGLDAMDRGSLLHAVLQCFWQGRDATWLQALGDAALAAAIGEAVEQGVALFSRQRALVLPAVFMRLEQQRLQRLLLAWLGVERGRQPFKVQACEREIVQDIAGLQVRLKLDRVDILPDDSLVVIDYKTGEADYSSWAADRISEPQLPIYAALALQDQQVAAVCFAKVRLQEPGFSGIALADDGLPGLRSLDGTRKVFDAAKFPDWGSLLQHWRNSILAIAGEIVAGEAAVRFADGADLTYCEVKPLLRLPERALQLERSHD